MNRIKLMVALARDREIGTDAQLPVPKEYNDVGMESEISFSNAIKTLPSVTGDDKVIHYLQRIKTEVPINTILPMNAPNPCTQRMQDVPKVVVNNFDESTTDGAIQIMLSDHNTYSNYNQGMSNIIDDLMTDNLCDVGQKPNEAEEGSNKILILSNYVIVPRKQKSEEGDISSPSPIIVNEEENVSNATYIAPHINESSTNLAIMAMVENQNNESNSKFGPSSGIQDPNIKNFCGQKQTAKLNNFCDDFKQKNKKIMIPSNKSIISNDSESDETEISSDGDYSPADNDYEPSLNSNSSEESEDPPEKDIPVVSTPTNKQSVAVSSSSAPIEIKEYIEVRHSLQSDKDLCPYCFQEVGHFSRHLLRRHSDEELMKKIQKLPLKSKERREAIISLKRKGNFIWKQERDQLKPVRKPNFNFLKNYSHGVYYPCPTCLGYYKKTYLWRHSRKCNSKLSNTGSKNLALTDSQTLLASVGLLGNYISKSRLKDEVFAIMRPDNISMTAKMDKLICLYGESYLNKHKRKQMNVVVSNKMREMARLKLALQSTTSIVELTDALKPEMYTYIVAACKVIAGYDEAQKTFKSSSLALHMGTNLKFLCDVAKKAIVTKESLFSTTNRDAIIKEISEIRDIINCHWCNDISSLANKVLNENKITKPKLLPVTQDIKAFNNYVVKLAEEAFQNLKNNIDIERNYKLLCESTLALVLVFNRKRIGEVQYLDIRSYENNSSSINQKESLGSLSELEKTLCSAFKRVIILGKGSKPVPILFTKKTQGYVDLLLAIRKNNNIVPETNRYIFANPGVCDKWMNGSNVLRKFAQKCGAKNPELLTSTRFRKQIATILQLMSFENDEMEQIAKFMGHTEKTHREFYRLSEDIYQTAKVAKVLLLLNAGKGSEFKGKSLNEIEVDETEIEEDENVLRKNNESIFDDPIENNYCNDQAGPSTTEHEEAETRKEIEIKEVKNIISRENVSGKGRVRWSECNKKLVLKFFQKHVKHKIAPKKDECLVFIRNNPQEFEEKDWVRVKTLVYNTYRDK